jgi:hypothetical protein
MSDSPASVPDPKVWDQAKVEMAARLRELEAVVKALNGDVWAIEAATIERCMDAIERTKGSGYIGSANEALDEAKDAIRALKTSGD